MNVGFIGMGIMGQAMAANVLKGGHRVVVYNRTPAQCAPVTAQGAQVAHSPHQLLDECDVVVVMLTGPEAIDSTLFGPDGALMSQSCAGKTVINMSTVSPAYAKALAGRLAGREVHFLDAPVSGSKKPAEDGTLVILAGGEPERIEMFTPLLLCMGKKVVNCGPVPAGSMMKMAVNLLLASMMEGLAEAVAFARKGGLDVNTVMDTIMAGPMSCGFFQLKDPMMRQGEFPPQFPLKHMTKDLKFVADTAYETGANAPSAHANLQLFRRAVAEGLGDADLAAIFEVLK